MMPSNPPLQPAKRKPMRLPLTNADGDPLLDKDGKQRYHYSSATDTAYQRVYEEQGWERVSPATVPGTMRKQAGLAEQASA